MPPGRRLPAPAGQSRAWEFCAGPARASPGSPADGPGRVRWVLADQGHGIAALCEAGHPHVQLHGARRGPLPGRSHGAGENADPTGPGGLAAAEEIRSPAWRRWNREPCYSRRGARRQLRTAWPGCLAGNHGLSLASPPPALDRDDSLPPAHRSSIRWPQDCVNGCPCLRWGPRSGAAAKPAITVTAAPGEFMAGGYCSSRHTNDRH